MHTPGPWKVGATKTEVVASSPNSAEWGVIASMGLDFRNMRESNARLITAAPELLDALQAIMRHPHILAYLPYDPNDATMRQAVAAIQKATE